MYLYSMFFNSVPRHQSIKIWHRCIKLKMNFFPFNHIRWTWTLVKINISGSTVHIKMLNNIALGVYKHEVHQENSHWYSPSPAFCLVYRVGQQMWAPPGGKLVIDILLSELTASQAQPKITENMHWYCSSCLKNRLPCHEYGIPICVSVWSIYQAYPKLIHIGSKVYQIIFLLLSLFRLSFMESMKFQQL